MARLVTLALVDAEGTLLGALEPFEVEIGWWNAVADVNRVVRQRFGADVQVLRILASPTQQPGGSVTYLAQLAAGQTLPPAELTPVEVDFSDDPRRAAYARPGGPAATIDWGTAAADRLGLGPVRKVEQRRTWNLSAIWRLHAAGSPLWIKEVPHFFGHEPAVLAWLGRTAHRATFPVLLASDGGRMLMANLPGEDLFRASAEVCNTIARDFHPVQVEAVSHVDELLGLGVPDRRFAALQPLLEAVAAPARTQDPVLDALVASLGDRLAAVSACGVPDTLVHGDLHPGNVRAEPGGPNVIMDWGDAFIGHPAFDILRVTERLPDEDARPVIEEWAQRWRATAAGSDPERAVELLRPVAALRNAQIYADFLAEIEPSEYPYHADDPAACLATASQLAAAEIAAVGEAIGPAAAARPAEAAGPAAGLGEADRLGEGAGPAEAVGVAEDAGIVGVAGTAEA